MHYVGSLATVIKKKSGISDLVHPSLLAMALAVYKRIALATVEITETGGSVVAIAIFDTAVFAGDIRIGSYC